LTNRTTAEPSLDNRLIHHLLEQVTVIAPRHPGLSLRHPYADDVVFGVHIEARAGRACPEIFAGVAGNLESAVLPSNSEAQPESRARRQGGHAGKFRVDGMNVTPVDEIPPLLAGIPMAGTHRHQAPIFMPGGWTAERLLDECGTLAATGRIVGVSVCCGNPQRDPDGRGAQAYAAAVRALLP